MARGRVGFLPREFRAGWALGARRPAPGRGRCCTARGFPACPPKVSVQAAGGAGQWPTELQPHPHSRCGPRSETRCEEPRDRARCPTPWLAFSHSPMVWTGVGTEWGRSPELALGVPASPVDLGRSPTHLAFYFYILRWEIIEDAYEIDLACENASGNAKPKQDDFH